MNLAAAKLSLMIPSIPYGWLKKTSTHKGWARHRCWGAVHGGAPPSEPEPTKSSTHGLVTQREKISTINIFCVR